MGTTTLQFVLNTTRMIDLGKIKKLRGLSSIPNDPDYLSDDLFARTLLFERLDELLKKHKGN